VKPRINSLTYLLTCTPVSDVPAFALDYELLLVSNPMS